MVNEGTNVDQYAETEKRHCEEGSTLLYNDMPWLPSDLCSIFKDNIWTGIIIAFPYVLP